MRGLMSERMRSSGGNMSKEVGALVSDGAVSRSVKRDGRGGNKRTPLNELGRAPAYIYYSRGLSGRPLLSIKIKSRSIAPSDSRTCTSKM